MVACMHGANALVPAPLHLAPDLPQLHLTRCACSCCAQIQGKSISSSPVTRRAKSDVVVHANSMQRAGQLAQQQALLKQQPYGQPQLSPSKPGASAHAPNARATPLISSSGRATQSAAASPMGRANSGTFGGTLLPNSGPINNMLTHAMRKGPPAPPSTSSRHGPHHPVTKAAAAAPPKLQAIPERGKAPPPVNSQPQAHSHPPQSPSKPRLSPPQPHASSPPPAMPPFGSRSAIMPPTEAALRQLPLADRPGTYRHVPSEVATHAGWWGRSNSGGAASNVSYPRTAVTESNSVTPSELAAWESRMSDLEKTIREERTRRARYCTSLVVWYLMFACTQRVLDSQALLLDAACLRHTCVPRKSGCKAPQ